MQSKAFVKAAALLSPYLKVFSLTELASQKHLHPSLLVDAKILPPHHSVVQGTFGILGRGGIGAPLRFFPEAGGLDLAADLGEGFDGRLDLVADLGEGFGCGLDLASDLGEGFVFFLPFAFAFPLALACAAAIIATCFASMAATSAAADASPTGGTDAPSFHLLNWSSGLAPSCKGIERVAALVSLPASTPPWSASVASPFF